MSSQRKPSVFAQRMKNYREAANTSKSHVDEPPVTESHCIAGIDMSDIHKENELLISNLSKNEIEEKQKELFRLLGSDKVEFLKNRRTRKKLKRDLSPTNPTIKGSTGFEREKRLGVEIEENQRSDAMHKNQSEPVEDLIKELKMEDHSESLEYEKLKWTEDVPALKSLPNGLYSARFDFEGNLLPYVIENESTTSKGLYHHGEEPQRPGYTLEELFQLTRSSFPRQRIFALNTIAAILENEVVLSSYLETELISQLLNSGIFLILRFALDERLKPVYLAALRAISALLWRAIDMHYLTETVGIFGDMQLPSFEVNNSTLDGVNETELKDTELLSLDIIKGCFRTNFIQRLNYILDDTFLETNHVLLIIKCLTRIAYHSDESVQIILKTPSLLEKLFSISRTPSKTDKLYIAKLLVLFRVMACHSKKMAETLNERFMLTSYISSIISEPMTKTTTVSQCIYLWHVLLYYEIAQESVSTLSPVLYSLLRQLSSKSIAQLESGVIVLANALISLFIFLFEKLNENVRFLVPILEQLACQWLNIFANSEQNSYGFVKLIANCVYLLTCTSALDESVPIDRNKIVLSVMQPRIFQKLVLSSEQLKNQSYLLNATKKNYTESLPSLCVPTCILEVDNNFFLLHAIVKYTLKYECFDDCEKHSRIIENVWNSYTELALHRTNLNQIASFWPARFEIYFLRDILFVSIRQKRFSPEQRRKRFRLAFTLLRIIHTDDGRLIKSILNNVLFNENLYGDAAETEKAWQLSKEYFDVVKQIFGRQLALPCSEMGLTSTKRGTECAMPTDWFYAPILNISNAFQSDEGAQGKMVDSNANTATLDCILKWVRFVESMADDIGTEMSVSTRFCRVCCVFFCGDSFLDLRDLLLDILRLLLKHNDQLEFKKPIAGLSSFYDFYRELCEQFASCSYGDPVFSAYLLVPLQQRHDVRLRLYLWCEQTVALRFITLKADQLPVSVDDYLQPVEKNLQLIETYLNVVATGRIKEKNNPFLFHIVVHHVTSFLRSSEEESVTKRLRQKIDRIGNTHLRDCLLNYEPMSLSE